MKHVKKQRPDRALAEVISFLKTKYLKAVLFNKGAGFCQMSNHDYQSKLPDIFEEVQFEKRTDIQGDFVVKLDANFNQNLNALYDAGQLLRVVYEQVRSFGGSPAGPALRPC